MTAAVRRTACFLLLFAAAAATAQNVCSDPARAPQTFAEAKSAVDALVLNTCPEHTYCPLCVALRELRKSKDPAHAVALLTDARNAAAAAGHTPELRHLVARIDRWIEIVHSGELADAAPAEWQYDTAAGGYFIDEPDAIGVEAMLMQRCASGTTACTAAYREAAEIVTDAGVVRSALGILGAADRKVLVAYLHGLDKRWEDYFRKSPAQFPWELLINSSIYRKHESRGYNEPPSWQLIALHPTAAYEYARGSSDKFKSALALEAVGAYAGNFGAALSLAWADRSDAKRLGFGVAAHWRNSLTVGVMHHAGEKGTSILLSPNIEKFIVTNVQRAREILTNVP